MRDWEKQPRPHGAALAGMDYGGVDDRPARTAQLSILRLRSRDDPRMKRPHGVGLRLRFERGEPITANRYLRVERLDQATERQFPLEHRDRQEGDAGALRRRLGRRNG